MRLKHPRAKGTRLRTKCMKELEEQGMMVSVVERGGKFTKEKDCFGLFDLVAVRPNMTWFVQVTSNTPHTHKKYLEFAKKFCGPNLLCIQAVWIAYKGWKAFNYYADGTKRVIKNGI